jgi:DNA-binding transcriptional ArsR family regulator
MARAATTLDPFNAIAEPKRRMVLEALAIGGEQPVNELVLNLGWPQPMVSKHLGVLRQVGLVEASERGRERIYRINGDRLRPVHEWTATFERFWSDHFDNIKRRAESKTKPKGKERKS